MAALRGKLFSLACDWPIDWLDTYLHSVFLEIILTLGVKAAVWELRCFTVTKSATTARALSTFISSTRCPEIRFRVAHWNNLALRPQLQCSLRPLHERSGGRQKGDSLWVTEDVGRRTTWVCLGEICLLFQNTYSDTDTFFCVIRYLVLARRAGGDSYC